MFNSIVNVLINLHDNVIVHSFIILGEMNKVGKAVANI